MVYDGEKILVENRISEDWHGYTLPGGHVEVNESFVDAVKREMKEETGLIIDNVHLVELKQFPIKGGRYFVALYRTNTFSGTLQSSNEGKVEWVDRKDIKNLETVSDFLSLLKVFDNDELSEFHYVKNQDQWKVVLK